MGTTKTGRVLNTQGAKGTASQYAVVHSSEGAYIKPQKGNKIRLKSGGHSQTGLEQLKKYGIKFNIIKTCPNGVRIGNIPNHKNPKKRIGMNQTWFPKNWTNKDIKKAGEHVSKLKSNRNAKDGVAVFGTWKGVRVGVIRTHGIIATIFPDSKQPKAKGRKK